MTSKHEAWLRQLARDKKGGFGARGGPSLRSIDRGQPYTLVFGFRMDLSADAFSASLRSAPDAGGATLADFTVTVGAFAAGSTPVTLELDAAQTQALTADDDFDGLAEVVFDLIWTPVSGNPQRALGGVIPVSGRVT